MEKNIKICGNCHYFRNDNCTFVHGLKESNAYCFCCYFKNKKERKKEFLNINPGYELTRKSFFEQFGGDIYEK